MKIQKVKNRGVMFTFFNSSEWDLNIHLIMGKRNNYIIDTGLGSSSIEPIKDYLKGNDRPIVVINTHYHWDHVWGNDSLSDSLIISHRLCRDIIEEKWEDMLRENRQYCDGKVEKCLPNLVFENELYFPEDKVRIIYTPGHTIDSISVIDEEDKVINAGDNIGDTLERIVPDVHCDKRMYMNTLSRYKDIDFDTCISGHNIILGKDVINKIIDNL